MSGLLLAVSGSLQENPCGDHVGLSFRRRGDNVGRVTLAGLAWYRFTNSGDAESFQCGLYVGAFEKDATTDAIKRQDAPFSPVNDGAHANRKDFRHVFLPQIWCFLIHMPFRECPSSQLRACNIWDLS